MQSYVGLDVSDKETSVCVMSDRGKILWQGKVLSDPQMLAEVIKRRAPKVEAIGLETGALTPWLARKMREKGLPVVCLDARMAKAVLKSRPIKTDKNDAKTLAELVQSGFYRSVHVKSCDAHRIRALLKGRDQLVRMRRRLMGTIRGLLKPFGLKMGQVSGGKFAARTRELTAQEPILSTTCEALLEALEKVTFELFKLDRLVQKIAKHNETCRRLMSVPGVGALTALAFMALIDDPARFTRARDAGAYLGLTPRRYQSGEIDRLGKISKWGDHLTRHYLYSAANVLITTVRGRSDLKSWGLKLRKRVGPKRARVAVARKLVTVLLSIWNDGTEFEAARSGAPATGAVA